jgi:hypothetical protein
MTCNVVRTIVINSQRIEMVHWAEDDIYDVNIYGPDGLRVGDARHFYNLYAAEQFYLDSLSWLAGSTP